MGLYEAANPYALSRGIMPLPGSPAYEALARNIMNSNPVNDAQSALQNTAQQAINKIAGNTGVNYGMVAPTGRDWGQGALAGTPEGRALASGGGVGGMGGGGASSGSSSMSSGAGLIGEILGRLRNVGSVEGNAARSRMEWGHAKARSLQMADAARTGMFRSGVNQQKMLEEIDRPFANAMSDLESNLADQNVGNNLRGTELLANIEARSRQAMAQQQAQQFASGSAMGSGEAYRTDKTGQGGIYGGMGGDGGMFGASFVDARKRQASGATGGGDTMGFMPNVPYLGGSTGAGQSASQSFQALPANQFAAQRIATPTGPQGQQIYGSGSSAYYRDPSGARMGATPAALAQQMQSQQALAGIFSGGASFGRR